MCSVSTFPPTPLHYCRVKILQENVNNNLIKFELENDQNEETIKNKNKTKSWQTVTHTEWLYARTEVLWFTQSWWTMGGKKSRTHTHTHIFFFKCCLMSLDVSWHVRDKLRLMHQHGSILLYVHGNQKGTATSTFESDYSPRGVQELCESRGGRPGLSVLTSLLVSVDVKLYWTMLRHWSQLVPNMSTDIWGH